MILRPSSLRLLLRSLAVVPLELLAPYLATNQAGDGGPNLNYELNTVSPAAT
jgi:hypothetical protein